MTREYIIRSAQNFFGKDNPFTKHYIETELKILEKEKELFPKGIKGFLLNFQPSELHRRGTELYTFEIAQHKKLRQIYAQIFKESIRSK